MRFHFQFAGIALPRHMQILFLDLLLYWSEQQERVRALEASLHLKFKSCTRTQSRTRVNKYSNSFELIFCGNAAVY